MSHTTQPFYVIAFGTVGSGFSFVGPFTTALDAVETAEREPEFTTWEIIPVYNPSETSEE